MKTTLYLVRHGETDYNRRQVMQGRGINSRLNPTGRRQAEALAARFAGMPLDAVYTSTLERAAETAEIVLAGHPPTPVRRLPGLDEMSWGIYEGEPYSERLQGALGAIYAAWDDGAFDHRIEGGESILDVQERALGALGEIVAAHPGGTVLVVSHGRLLRVLLASVLEGYGLARMSAILHANTSVNRLLFENGCYTADLLNCTAHLDRVEMLLLE